TRGGPPRSWPSRLDSLFIACGSMRIQQPRDRSVTERIADMTTERDDERGRHGDRRELIEPGEHLMAVPRQYLLDAREDGLDDPCPDDGPEGLGDHPVAPETRDRRGERRDRQEEEGQHGTSEPIRRRRESTNLVEDGVSAIAQVSGREE